MDKRALEIFLKHFQDPTVADVFRQRWGMNTVNNGGLDMDTSKADIKLKGKAEGVNISNKNLPFDVKDFKGFTYSITRLERFRDNGEF